MTTAVAIIKPQILRRVHGSPVRMNRVARYLIQKVAPAAWTADRQGRERHADYQ